MNSITSMLAQCESAPTSFYEPLILPLLFTIFGSLIFVAGKVGETRDMKPKPWKWSGFLLIAVALFTGGRTASCLRDAFYAASVEQGGKKMMLGHWSGFLLPLIAIIALGVWQYTSSRDPYK